MAKIIGSSVLILFMIFLPQVMSGPYYLHISILTMVNIILAGSLRLISLSGQLSLAHGGMMTIGAYTSTLLVMKLGLSSWTAFIIAGAFVALIACLTGYPFMRLKGIYFSIVTIFFSEMIVLVAQQWESLTGGNQGIFNIPGPDPVVIPGIAVMDFSTKTQFYYLALFLTAVSLLILYAIEKSRVGFTLKGIKQSNSLAESTGIDTTGFKVLAYSIGCFFAGITGAFQSQYISTISPDTFGFFYTIYILIYMIVGGPDVFIGPVIGAFVLTILPEITRDFREFVPFLFASVLIIIIFFFPEGLAGIVIRFKTFIVERIRLKHA